MQKGDNLEVEIEDFLVENFKSDFENLHLLANSVWVELLLESEANNSEEVNNCHCIFLTFFYFVIFQ